MLVAWMYTVLGDFNGSIDPQEQPEDYNGQYLLDKKIPKGRASKNQNVHIANAKFAQRKRRL